MLCSWGLTMLVDKRLRSVYPLMLPMGQGKKTTAAIENTRFNTCKFGSYKSVVADFNLNNDGHRGNVPTLSATAAILDGGKSVDYFVKGSPDYVFLSDRTDGYDKVYWQRSSQTNMITAYAGDTMSGTREKLTKKDIAFILLNTNINTSYLYLQLHPRHT